MSSLIWKSTSDCFSTYHLGTYQRKITINYYSFERFLWSFYAWDLGTVPILFISFKFNTTGIFYTVSQVQSIIQYCFKMFPEGPQS